MIRGRWWWRSVTGMSIQMTIHNHDTQPELYAALTRAFPESENGGTRWVTLLVGNVSLTFYASTSAESHDDDPNEGIDVPVGPLNPEQEAAIEKAPW